ncbi:MAG: MBL fold metallo-hydrolase [Clostridia bacterium]|nr:MBL fold metallo-hydrolase [Clostridia bacterium]
MARFCPLFSGSSGNCLYIGTSTAGILIDAGVSARRIEQALCTRDIDPATIRAVFVTHEHTDHITGLRVLQKRYHMPIYASVGTCEGIEEAAACDSCCTAMTDIVELDEFAVTAFPTSHDSRESTGFRITLRDGRNVGVATDLGIITPTVREQLRGCDLVHIESNHDVRMLENGPYPYVLKRRILSATGHLSNEACAKELPELIRHGTTRVFLGHLSRENNMPTLADATADATLQTCGMTRNIDYLLQVAPPENDKPYILF